MRRVAILMTTLALTLSGLMVSPAHADTAGIDWTKRTGIAGLWDAVAYGNGKFVAVSETSGQSQVMTSPDGITWTAQTAPLGSWYGVTYANGLFVAVSWSGDNSVMTSPDGITWTARTVPAGAADAQWNSVTYGNGKFVAVASVGTNRVMTSTDGVSWTEAIPVENNSWWSITYGNASFVAVAQDGVIMKSPDGLNWLTVASTAGTWRSVTYANGVFVAVAASGTNRAIYSTDGENWTSSALYGSWRSVTYGSGMFVAVGANNLTNDPAIMTSPDGITWTIRTVPETAHWNSVTHANGMFVAVGQYASDGKNIMTSNTNAVDPPAPAPAGNSVPAIETPAQVVDTGLAARTVSAKKKFSAKSLAKQVGVTIVSSKATVSISAAKSYKKVCTKSGAKLRTLKAGNCVVTFTVQEPKPKKGKKPKATKTTTTLVVQ